MNFDFYNTVAMLVWVPLWAGLVWSQSKVWAMIKNNNDHEDYYGVFGVLSFFEVSSIYLNVFEHTFFK